MRVLDLYLHPWRWSFSLDPWQSMLSEHIFSQCRAICKEWAALPLHRFSNEANSTEMSQTLSLCWWCRRVAPRRHYVCNMFCQSSARAPEPHRMLPSAHLMVLVLLILQASGAVKTMVNKLLKDRPSPAPYFPIFAGVFFDCLTFISRAIVSRAYV